MVQRGCGFGFVGVGEAGELVGCCSKTVCVQRTRGYRGRLTHRDTYMEPVSVCACVCEKESRESGGRGERNRAERESERAEGAS